MPVNTNYVVKKLLADVFKDVKNWTNQWTIEQHK